MHRVINLIVSHEMWTQVSDKCTIEYKDKKCLSGGRRDGGNTGLGILIWKGAVNLERELESVRNSMWHLCSGLREV